MAPGNGHLTNKSRGQIDPLKTPAAAGPPPEAWKIPDDQRKYLEPLVRKRLELKAKAYDQRARFDAEQAAIRQMIADIDHRINSVGQMEAEKLGLDPKVHWDFDPESGELRPRAI